MQNTNSNTKFKNDYIPLCSKKIQHKQYVELKLKTREFAKMAINTSLRSAALCAP